MTCTACGALNDDGRRFCDQCGTALAAGCPTCGATNRPEARFCGDCGAPLVGGISTSARSDDGDARLAQVSPGTAERRLVSVLFADLVGFTTYAEGRDPEQVRDVLTRYFEATRTVIERHGGRVEKFIGDAVMAEWGAPRANEDDAERAVRAALEVVEAVRGLGEGLEPRIGVLTGQAAVTLDAEGQGMVAGDLVNTAARLQGVAPPGTVLVGETTMTAAVSAIAFEPAGEQLLKGKSTPVPAWRALRVISDRGGRGRTEGLEPPFVGRELELRLLKDLLHASGVERRPRLVSIVGPAGIGKSRLAWEFEKYIDGLVEDVYWHRGRAPSYGEGVTFWALGEMVRRRAGLVESDDEATTRARIADTVAEWVPDEADRAWIEPALLTLLGLESPPTGGREVLFSAWRTFFERIAAQGTTVLLFEDLQWADSGQLDFIEHVLEWSKAVPLLVITLARPDLLERRPGWGTTVRSFNAIGLEPLTGDQMRELLLGVVPELPAAAVERILARADGIPLYAVETMRMLVSEGRLTANTDGTFRPVGDLGELAVPDSLRALVASRLDALPAEDRALLQDAAVLGKSFGTAALAAVSDKPVDGLEDRLRGLARRELLEVSVDPRAPERGQYGFVQSVIREVAYETLARRDRRSRHLAAARYFEAQGDDELAGILATHYLAAHRASDPGPEADALQAQARLALRAAADRAVALGAAAQAIAFLEQALAISHEGSDRGELFERAAIAADIDGRYDDAEAFGHEAIAAFEAAGNHSAVARASASMGGILADAGKMEATVAFVEGALEKADRPDDRPHRAYMLARLARAHMRLAQWDQALARADEALAIAEPLRLDHVIAESFVNKGSALSGLGRVREPALLIGAAIDLAAEVGDHALELRARNNLSSLLFLEDLPRAMAIIREAYDLAVRLGIGQMSRWLAGTVAYGSMYEGLDWDTDLRRLDDELGAVRAAADRARLLSMRRALMALRGEDTSAIRAEWDALRGSVADPDAAGWTLIDRGLEAQMAGRLAEALDAFRDAIAEGAQNTADARILLVHAAHWDGDPVAVRAARDEAFTEVWAGIWIDAMRDLADAGVHAVEGRTSEAISAFTRAIHGFERNGALFDVARAQLDAIILLPDEPIVRAWADEARDRFERLGARPFLERLEQALAARVA
jgi:class 3 adenylate cyclase/tetratricopeptide (TPR) repeat protein